VSEGAKEFDALLTQEQYDQFLAEQHDEEALEKAGKSENKGQ
jgi:hypothetical protein